MPRNPGEPPVVSQPVTDDSIKVRQLTHYQFSWVFGEPAEEGTFTLQLVLDQGAWEEVLTVDSDDAPVVATSRLGRPPGWWVVCRLVVV